MLTTFLIAAVLLLSLICGGLMFSHLKRQPPVLLTATDYIKLATTGVISFISDTLGIGSFAVNIALSKYFNTFADEELPAMNNGAQVIPGAIESLFFISSVNVDVTTLLVLILGACIGGVIGGFVVTHLSKQAIRFALMICFSVIIILLVGDLMPAAGSAMGLHGTKLWLGFFAMILCGGLTSFGIGLFVLVQVVLFLLNVSPQAAFPIMTTAGAMQQPLTTMVFLHQGKIPLKKTLILSLSGCVGVLIGVYVFSHMTTAWLHSLLVFILIYNLWGMGRAYWLHRQKNRVDVLPQTAI